MMILEICKYMNWDYWTYIKQPYWIIRIILARIDGESNAKNYFKLKG